MASATKKRVTIWIKTCVSVLFYRNIQSIHSTYFGLFILLQTPSVFMETVNYRISHRHANSPDLASGSFPHCDLSCLKTENWKENNVIKYYFTVERW